MPLNKIKVKLVKTEGTNCILGKGKLDLENKVVTEKQGLVLRDVSHYRIEPSHIKRQQKGKAIIGIDLKTKRSFDLDMKVQGDIEYKCHNCLEYLMQLNNWKANQSGAKIPKWHDIKMMFAGFGLLFFILFLVNVIFGRGLGLI